MECKGRLTPRLLHHFGRITMKIGKAFRMGQKARTFGHTPYMLVVTAAQLRALHGKAVSIAYLRGAGLSL